MWIVYLLISEIKNISYVGITTNLDKRLKQHNGIINGGAKFTHANRPYKVLYYIDNIENRSDATKIELLIKQQKGAINRLFFMEKINKKKLKIKL